MSPEPPRQPNETSLIIRTGGALAKMPDGGSPALAEIISRSLIHIQTSKALGMLHRIGEHELYGPDYRLICAWGEELGRDPADVLDVLVSYIPFYERNREIEWDNPLMSLHDHRIEYLHFPHSQFPSLHFPKIAGLRIKELSWQSPELLDLSMFPMLTKLWRFGKQLTELDLSAVPNLETLHCYENQLTELDLSAVPNLEILCCYENQLTELDLSAVPNLVYLDCSKNQLTALGLSAVPYLTELWCVMNQLTELDLSKVSSLTFLACVENQLTELDLSEVPNLLELYCYQNQLNELDLSQVPNLVKLQCSNNLLTELDIRPLLSLSTLVYDIGKTRLIQRPDQNF